MDWQANTCAEELGLPHKSFYAWRLRILDDPTRLGSAPHGFDRWLWSTEPFPYPAWSLCKLTADHPEDVGAYFTKHRDRMKGPVALESRKAFFNYCKMAVAACGTAPELSQEIQSAEAIVRFFAGTYFGLELSALLVGLIQCWLTVIVATQGAYPLWAVMFGAITAAFAACLRLSALFRFSTVTPLSRNATPQ
jgi:hypothetical protein